MSNKSHYNSGHYELNKMSREGSKHSSDVEYTVPESVNIMLKIDNCLNVLHNIPDNSIQLIVIDPPYNLDLAHWDAYNNYIDWAKEWIEEAIRVLSPNGNLVIFGGMQYQGEKSGDLLELLHYTRHETKLRLVNMIIWYYKNGMGAHRFFANRHEEIAWFTKTNKYYFDLDSVRVKYDQDTLELYLKDPRLNPNNVEKGKNPTNVWEIGRLNGNSLERVGHETQKPLEVIRRVVKSMSYPGSIVLDFFAGSGTTGIICIEERRNCILCDSDPRSIDFLNKHIENMKKNIKTSTYQFTDNLDSFFKK